MKKLLIIIILLITAAVGFYFGYWTNTPAYAAGEIQQAVQKKDLQLFKERVDMEKVYSSAIDDILSELKADGQPEHKMAATVIKGLKKDLIRELIRRTELKFQAKEVLDHCLHRFCRTLHDRCFRCGRKRWACFCQYKTS